MRELLYLGVGLFAGTCFGVAGMACITAGSRADLVHKIAGLERELTVVRASRNYHEAVAGQWERAYEIECTLRKGIAEVGRLVDAAVEELGL